MKIKNLDTAKKVIVIAEIGNNHEGSYTLAEDMIGRAAEAGADAVKFQTIIPERLVSLQDRDRIQQLNKFKLSYNEFAKLEKVAKKQNIIFLSTPFDIDSALFLNELVSAYKIASGDNNFFPLIQVIARTGKPIIMSTGLANIDEIKKTVTFIKKIWNDKGIKQELALLHCISCYPTSLGNANLLSIHSLKKFTENVGYSDHTQGIEAAIYSVAVGAMIIEKHFTIDNNYSDFHDHKLSADPKDFKRMVEKIRSLEKILGNKDKKISKEELKNKETIRRSITARYDLENDHVITYNDLNWVRPGTGILPGNEFEVIGKKVKKLIKAGQQINKELLY